MEQIEQTVIVGGSFAGLFAAVYPNTNAGTGRKGCPQQPAFGRRGRP